MTAIIRTWHPNILHSLFKGPREVSSELETTLRRVFAPMAVVQMYAAREHCWVDQDDIGQWGDDGGRHVD